MTEKYHNFNNTSGKRFMEIALVILFLKGVGLVVGRNAYFSSSISISKPKVGTKLSTNTSDFL